MDFVLGWDGGAPLALGTVALRNAELWLGSFFGRPTHCVRQRRDEWGAQICVKGTTAKGREDLVVDQRRT